MDVIRLREFSSTTEQILGKTPSAQEEITKSFEAATLRDVNSLEETIEYSYGLLLNSKSNHPNLEHPFYSLPNPQKFLLYFAHRHHWSYDRLCKLFKLNRIALETLLFQCRLQLSPSHIPVPSGPKSYNLTCPEYNPKRPWTQRFLDEECHGQEAVFLKSHLFHCENCRSVLSRYRKFFYEIEKIIPSKKLNSVTVDKKIKETWTDSRIHFRHQISVEESLERFGRNNQRLLLLLGILVGLSFFIR